MSLYRKYRPQNFGSLVGQDHVSVTLSNALKLGRVSHAYLFTGPRGTGKTTTARIMAKAVNCLNLKDGTPCEECEICRDINDGRLIDVIEIDAASNRGIDEMRDLKEKINFAPTRAKNKVYIIDEVHMLTKEAFNALLKTLEEPPPNVYFILATTEVHKVPETILSRCQRFDFRRINLATMVDRLKFIAAQEKIEAEEKALQMVADHAQGGMRDAIGLMEQMSVSGKLLFDYVCTVLGVSGYASIEKLYGFLIAGNAAGALDELHALYEEGFDLINFNKNFLEYLRKRLLESVEKNDYALTGKLLDWISIFQSSYEQARHTPIAQLPLEVAVIEAVIGREAPAGNNNVAVRATAVKPETAPRAAASRPEAAPVPTMEMPMERKHAGINEAKTEAGEQTYTLTDIKAKWKEIMAAIKLPSAKQALMQAVLTRAENHDITLTFASNFYLEKVKEPGNRLEIENAFNQVLKASVKIMAELKATGSGNGAGGTLPDPNTLNVPGGDTLAENVLEIFGGEVVK